MDILIINGHDYSRFIERGGYGWERNDLDSEKTTRTKDGTMRRDKITTKRKCTYNLVNMSREQLAALDDDLSAETFVATTLDLHGSSTRTYYCSSFKAKLEECSDGVDSWGEAAFNMIEV